MNKQHKSLKDFEVFSENPYQSLLRGSIRFQWRKNDADVARPMVDTDSGEVVFLSDQEKVKLILKDTSEFCKVYTPALEKLKELTMPGICMLSYVLSVAQKDTDWVRIDVPEAMKYSGYNSRSNVYSGILCLLKHDFISRKTGGGGEYFLNVSLFFNGKRTGLNIGRGMKDRLMDEMKRGRLDITKYDEEKEQ